MRTTVNIFGLALLGIMLLPSCGSMKDTAQVRDDVYFMPSSAPPPTAKATAPAKQNMADDYYDPSQANAYNDPRGFYDMAYNDPRYYNYGRFGFGMGAGMGMGMGMGMMGWQTGWNGPGWGMGHGWGMGWNDPWYGGYYGQWGQPWGMYPMGGMYNPYGYGMYNGPWGSCYGCYVPVVIGDGSYNNSVSGHRRSLNSWNNAGNPGGPDMGPKRQGMVRNPISLDRSTRAAAYAPSSEGSRNVQGAGRRGHDVAQPLNYGDHGRSNTIRPGNNRSEQARPSRNAPRGGSQDRSGGFDRGGNSSFGSGSGGRSGGGTSSPAGGGSRSGGGGRR